MAPTVTIGCFHEHLEDADGAAIVAIDVLRATTTAITAVTRGRRCFVAASIEEAVPLAGRLDDPLLAGELGGSMPYGFHVQNSPSELDTREDTSRAMVLLSTSGTRLMREGAARGPAYAACLRNVSAQAAHLIGRHENVHVLGADTRGEFRDEDQLCAARIAARLVESGYTPSNPATEDVLARWAGAPDDAFVAGRSATYLRRTGQDADLEFVLAHVDDVNDVFAVSGDEVVVERNA